MMMPFARWIAAFGVLIAIAGAASAPAQQSGRPPVTPKPGYVVPPENSAGLYPVSGEPVFKEICSGCHEPAVDRAPSRQELSARSPEEVYDALTIGAMKPMGDALTPAQIYGVEIGRASCRERV